MVQIGADALIAEKVLTPTIPGMQCMGGGGGGGGTEALPASRWSGY